MFCKQCDWIPCHQLRASTAAAQGEKRIRNMDEAEEAGRKREQVCLQPPNPPETCVARREGKAAED